MKCLTRFSVGITADVASLYVGAEALGIVHNRTPSITLNAPCDKIDPRILMQAAILCDHVYGDGPKSPQLPIGAEERDIYYDRKTGFFAKTYRVNGMDYLAIRGTPVSVSRDSNFFRTVQDATTAIAANIAIVAELPAPAYLDVGAEVVRAFLEKNPEGCIVGQSLGAAAVIHGLAQRDLKKDFPLARGICINPLQPNEKNLSQLQGRLYVLQMSDDFFYGFLGKQITPTLVEHLPGVAGSLGAHFSAHFPETGPAGILHYFADKRDQIGHNTYNAMVELVRDSYPRFHRPEIIQLALNQVPKADAPILDAGLRRQPVTPPTEVVRLAAYESPTLH